MDLKTETWGREINEIINYDSKELFLNDTKINSSGCIYRLHNRIFFMNDATNVKDYEKLIEINKTENRYELNFNKFEFDKKGNINTINTAWFLLKSSKMKSKYNKYRLKKGDVIKIGRIFTRIKDIKFEKNKKSKKGDENSSIDFEIISNKSKNGNSKIILMDVDGLNKKKEINNKNRVYSLANQRNATDSNLEEKIQLKKGVPLASNTNAENNTTLNASGNAPTDNSIEEDKGKEKEKEIIKLYVEKENQKQNDENVFIEEEIIPNISIPIIRVKNNNTTELNNIESPDKFCIKMNELTKELKKIGYPLSGSMINIYINYTDEYVYFGTEPLDDKTLLYSYMLEPNKDIIKIKIINYIQKRMLDGYTNAIINTYFRKPIEKKNKKKDEEN